jgi:hypothetical protein
VFYGTFLQAGVGIFKLIPALFCTPLLCHLPVVLKFLLGTCIGIRICCTEIELPNNPGSDAFFVPGVGYNGGDVIAYALGISFHYGSLYPPKQ